MPKAIAKVIVHIVFSTKCRAKVLTPDIRPALFAYMATVVRCMGCECYAVGGVDDHVHLAVGLSRTITLAALMKELKQSSSRWLKAQSVELEEFSWQRGYGAFSANYQGVPGLRRYIERQEEHHAGKSYQAEYRMILARNDIEYDERYVWD